MVGAGLAGLACAGRLAALGHRVEVFERAAAPGGRLRPDREGAFRVEPAGAQGVVGDEALAALAGELGLGAVRLADATRRALLRAGQAPVCDVSSLRALLRTAAVGAAGRARLPWLLVELFGQRHRLESEHPEEAAALDATPLAARLGRRLGEEAAAAVLTPALAALRGEGPQEVSAGLGLAALRRLQGGDMRPLQLRDGLADLARRLADRVPVRVGFDVVAAPGGAGADAGVRYVRPSGERHHGADAVVLAVDAPAVRRLCPDLSDAERAFLESADDAAPRREVHLLFEKAPPALPAPHLDVPEGEGSPLVGVTALHAMPGLAPEGAGHLRALLGAVASEGLRGASDEAHLAAVREALAGASFAVPEPDAVVVRSEAGPRIHFGPGCLQALRRLREEPAAAPRRVFTRAWRYASTAGEAAASGRRAADALDARLRA